MKKFLSILLVMLMVIPVMLTGCKFGLPKDTTNSGHETTTTGGNENPSSGEVILTGFSVSDSAPVGDFDKKSSIYFPSMSRILMAGTDGEENEPEVQPSITLIYKTQTVVYLTIKLYNPKNFYILDFKLSCPDEDIKIKQGNHLSSINDENTFIRWDESEDRIGNHQATFELHLANADVSPSKIIISNMYYSDRTDGSNKSVVNLNNKETTTIYKFDEILKLVDERNSLTEYRFKLEMNENVNKESVKFFLDGKDVVPEVDETTGEYVFKSEGLLRIEYEILIKEGLKYSSSVEREMKFIKVSKFIPYLNPYAINNLSDGVSITLNIKFENFEYEVNTTGYSFPAVENILIKDHPTGVIVKNQDNIAVRLYEVGDYTLENVIIIINGFEYSLYEIINNIV